MAEPGADDAPPGESGDEPTPSGDSGAGATPDAPTGGWRAMGERKKALWIASAVAAGGVGVWLIARAADPNRLDPTPPRPTSDLLLSEAPASTLSVPIGIPMSILVDIVEDAVPRTHGTPDSLVAIDQGRASIGLALEREPFRASLVGDVARIETTLRYSLRVSIDLPALPDPGGSCGFGDERPGIAVALSSPMSLAQDWSLRTRAQIADIRPASEEDVDRCEIAFVGMDITGRVVDGARSFLAEHLSDIDRRAAGADTRSSFEEWWNILQSPIRLTDSLWLAIGPQAVRRGPVVGTGDSLRVDLSLTAQPHVLFGSRPDVVSVPLPPLDTGSVEPLLDLMVDGRAEYDTGSQFLTEELAGTEREVGGRLLRFESIRVYGIGGGKLALEVGISGDLNGRVFLTGTPTIDSGASRISIPDLDLDVASENALFGFVPDLAARAFRDFLRERASWPVDPAVKLLADYLAEGLNRNLSSDLRVAGTVDSVNIVGLYPLRDVLLVRVSARGTATLQVVE